MNNEDFLDSLPDDRLVNLYGDIVRKLKERGIIRSKNVVGDLAEYLAINYYSGTPGLSNLQAAPTGTQNVDALSRNGERYSIKGTTSNTTGVFYGLEDPRSQEPDIPKFEYVIVVLFDSNFRLKRINELTWAQFLEYKRWHSRMRAWNLSITRDLLENTKTICQESNLNSL